VLRLRGVVSLAGAADFGNERARLLDTAAALRAGFDLRPSLAALFLSPGGMLRPDFVDDVRTWLDATDPVHLASELEAFAEGPNLIPDLARVDLRVLIRVGELDAVAPGALSAPILGSVKRSALEVARGVGHALLLEDFSGTAASVERFARDAFKEEP
jgi:pimeloyl-ACP methyl ester carboxylesterase